MNWYILIPLIVGVICAILGYLIGKSSCKKEECNCEEQTATQNKLEDIVVEPTTTETTPLTQNLISEVEDTFDSQAAKLAFGKKIVKDDLTVIEGIGPKISELFNNGGIETWKALSEASIEECQAILDGGGDRFKLHKPGSWPKQAKLAYEGKWQELKELQDILDGGK